MKPKTIKLNYGERVIGVCPERCAGPGWSNAVVWVHIATNDGKLRTEDIQPEERTPAMHTLFAAGEAMAQALVDAVPVVKAKRPNVGVQGRRPSNDHETTDAGLDRRRR